MVVVDGNPVNVLNSHFTQQLRQRLPQELALTLFAAVFVFTNLTSPRTIVVLVDAIPMLIRDVIDANPNTILQGHRVHSVVVVVRFYVWTQQFLELIRRPLGFVVESVGMHKKRKDPPPPELVEGLANRTKALNSRQFL
ncbi:hypothetical protein H310_14940 [Aphanomyces invadans]|uniref:Uncharacterized protein n=1 Tax=Aphanomyces invadans TaxID=157072 RepID=A0A024T8A9_9STRA|nr:hypothetical protein H310_14940 [Aphanomyces invadans]ETV90228.1 hypothetical protein H310_14940 [Aphanomyces invadans]|eukprot:XP_008881139.1 hypothetical protein H310_14940 [Aphanomyces invadans]